LVVEMINDLIEFIKSIKPGNIVEKKIVRDDASRNTHIYDYIEYTSINQVITSGFNIVDIDGSTQTMFINNIYGLDSSSRVVDTPYLFIAIGSATLINRFTGDSIDYPNITDVLTGGRGDYRYIVLIPEIEGYEDRLETIEKLNVITKNPAGYPYTYKYNKYVVLDELRLSLENNILKQIIYDDRFRDLYLFIDGPIYYTPPLLYQLNEMHGVRDELIKQYVEAWRTLVLERINILSKLMKEKNITVLGIVKRLNKSNVLSRIDPLSISSRSMSDEAYLTVLSTIRYSDKKVSPFIAGPLIYDPGLPYIDLPRKTIYYVGVPKRFSIGSLYRSFTFYRVEFIEGSSTFIDPVIYDSVYSGSTLPLTILIADSKSKKMTAAITNYIIRLAGLPSESTQYYISF